MDPISILLSEHRLIDAVLTAFERLADEIRSGASAAPMSEFATFFHDFVGVMHHGKEEDILLPTMVERDLFPIDILPVTDILDEHERGQRTMSEIGRLAATPGLEGASRERLVELAHAYARVLRHHIASEDRLFVRLSGRLSESTVAEIDREFALRATEQGGRERDLVALGERLARRAAQPSACGS